MALDDRDRRALAEIARQLRADDPEFAATLTGPPRRPHPAWAPIHVRVLAILLIAVGVGAPAPALVGAALVVFGIAQLLDAPHPPRSTPAGREGLPPPPHGS